jgi:hypothetical protein
MPSGRSWPEVRGLGCLHDGWSLEAASPLRFWVPEEPLEGQAHPKGHNDPGKGLRLLEEKNAGQPAGGNIPPYGRGMLPDAFLLVAPGPDHWRLLGFPNFHRTSGHLPWQSDCEQTQPAFLGVQPLPKTPGKCHTGPRKHICIFWLIDPSRAGFATSYRLGCHLVCVCNI